MSTTEALQKECKSCGETFRTLSDDTEHCSLECSGLQSTTVEDSHYQDEEGGPRYRDEQWLREKYVGERLTQYEIADLCDVGQSTIGKWLRKHDISSRSRGSRVPDERLTDKEWLRQKYIEERLATTEISDILDCDDKTVGRWLEEHDIPRRNGGFLSGEDHPNWKDEPASDRPYQSGWSKSVKERDGYECQDCGQDGGDLEAHHIERVVDAPEKADDVDNGVTLCVQCHANRHKNDRNWNRIRSRVENPSYLKAARRESKKMSESGKF